MAKTTYPYVIAWHANPGRVDLWTRKGAWGAEFRFDIMKLFKTLKAAEKEAFKIAVLHRMIGDGITVYRFDNFVRRVATSAAVDDKNRDFLLRNARRWMARRPTQGYFMVGGRRITVRNAL